LQFIISRAWFYMHGDALESMAAAATKGAPVGQVVSSVAGATAAATAESLKEL